MKAYELFKQEVLQLSNACTRLADAIEAYENEMKKAGQKISPDRKKNLDYLYEQVEDWDFELMHLEMDYIGDGAIDD